MAVAAEVAKAEVVSEDDHDVRFGRGLRRPVGSRETGRERQCNHDCDHAWQATNLHIQDSEIISR